MSGLPSWLLARALIPFVPKDHPWHGRRFTLTDWCAHETQVCRDFDTTLWLCVPTLIWGLMYLFS